MQPRAAAAGQNDSFAFHFTKLAVLGVPFSVKIKTQIQATRPQ
jgi:hypothetical protein